MIENILSWLAQSSVAALLLLILGYLCRHLIEARLSRSVQHEFDKKLAAFREKLAEEARRSEAVRNAGFAAQLAQRNLLATKRVEAAQGLWEGVLDARKGIFVASSLDILKVDEVAKEAHDPRMQTLLKTMVPEEVMSDGYSSKLISCAKYQPFVSPKAWAFYAAYSTIILVSISKIKMLQAGYNPSRFVKDFHWVSLLGAVLPSEDAEKIGKSTDYGLQWALKRLEDRIVDELKRSMTGESAGLEGAGDAQKILEMIDKYEISAAKAQEEATRASKPP
jgi:hypothetical protein